MKKKKIYKYINKPVIISLSILLIVTIAFVISSFVFTTTENGVWKLTENNIDYYYNFDSETSLCSVTIGTVTYFGGNYDKGYANGKDTITFTLSEGVLDGTYAYDIKDSRAQNKDTLNLYSSDTTYTLTQADLPDVKDVITTTTEFVPDKQLIGTWETSFGDLEDMKQTVTFDANGIMVLNQSGVMQYECMYTTADGTIISTYMYDTQITQNFDYFITEDGVLNYKDLEWTKIS